MSLIFPPPGTPTVIPLYWDGDNSEFVPGAVIDPGGNSGGAALASITQPNSNGSTSYTQPTVGATSADNNSASTQRGLDVRAFLLAFDGTNFDRVRSGTNNADGVAVNTAGGVLSTRAFLYGFNGTTFDRLRIDAGDRLTTIQREEPPGTLATVADTALASGSNTSISAASSTRRQIIVQNVDASDNVRIGDTNITTTRGIRLLPGESVTLNTTAQIFGRAEANTPSVSVTTLSY